VGETIAAAPLVKRLQQRYPDLPITVTTMTPTGSERVQALFGDGVFHVYAPYDMPDAVARFLRRVQPALAIVMETEVWPNTVAACEKRAIPVVLANARLSEKSFNGYSKFKGLVSPAFAYMNIVAQTAIEAERFQGLGAQHCSVSGSIKFDISLNDTLQQKALALCAEWKVDGRKILVAASTHEGEEALILQACKTICAEEPSRLIIVPRHPERFAPVAELISKAGLNFQKRSSGEAFTADVLLADTMGELLLLLGVADIAFVGGSLIERGGHNMLEPAAWGLPIITGQSDFNFAEISQLLQSGGALFKVSDAETLAELWLRLIANADQRASAGAAAEKVMSENRGALDKLLKVIDQQL
jgi:3-deoxy-D-manno-octulosonic-acid transferase